jgi:hypothetical protein
LDTIISPKLLSKKSTGSKIIKHQNDMYSMGSRWSQKYKLFNKLYWEPTIKEYYYIISEDSNQIKSIIL